MASSTVRIRKETRETLRELAREAGAPMQDVLAAAVELYRRELLLARTNAAYAALRADSRRWQAELEERAAWEATLADDLETE